MTVLVQYKRFFLVEQMLVPVIINALFNVLVLYLLLRQQELIPLWGAKIGVGGDVIATLILLPALTHLFGHKLIGSQIKSNKLPKLLAKDTPALMFVSWAPWKTACLLSIVGLLVFALPLVGLLQLAGLESMDAMAYIVFKALWAGLLGAIFAPISALYALVKHSQ